MNRRIKDINRDTIVNISFNLAVAFGPIVTLGSVGLEAVYIPSLICEGIFTLIMLVRLVMLICKARPVYTPRALKIMNDLFLPYAIILSALILLHNGVIDWSQFAWGIGLALLTLVADLLPVTKP